MAFGGETAESYYDDGLTASMKGDVRRAIQCFEKAIRLDNSIAAAYHQLAKCYLRMGNAKRAVDLLSEVIRKRPSNGPARLDLGHALIAVGNVGAARTEFAQIFSMDPSNARAQLGLALCSFHEGDWHSAVTQAQAALLSGGSNFSVLFLLGRAAKLAGDAALAQNSLDAAEKLIQKSVELNPDQPECHYLRGEVCFVRDQIASALEHYRAADDRIDSANPDRVYTAFGESFGQVDVWAKLGLCYQRLGKLDRAREMGARIVARCPEHKLGQALSALGPE